MVKSNVLIKSSMKYVIAPFFLGIFLAATMTIIAFASYTSETSEYYEFTEGDYTYENVTMCMYNSSGIKAITIIGTSDSSNVPAKYMWAQGRIYDDEDTLIDSSTGKYNTSSTAVLRSNYTDVITSSGTYYSLGLTKVWSDDDNKYVKYETFQTQYLTY